MSKVEHIQVNIKIDSNIYNPNKPTVARDDNGIKEKKKNEDYIIDISIEGKQKAEKINSSKTKGVTSARETWEVSLKNLKTESQLTGPYANLCEVMRIDEPETYEKYIEAHGKKLETLKHTENGLTNYTTVRTRDDLTEEGKYYEDECYNIFNEWFNRRYLANHHNLGDIFSQKIEELNHKFSDSIHNVVFNIYGGNNPIAESLWRYNSKFNVLISKSMFDILLEGDSEENDKLISSLTDSIGQMKEIELNYEGNLSWLRFGVKLHDDGKITYHANFEGCKNKDGIMADSSKKVLEELNKFKVNYITNEV